MALGILPRTSRGNPWWRTSTRSVCIVYPGTVLMLVACTRTRPLRPLAQSAKTARRTGMSCSRARARYTAHGQA
eukprot:scaffold646615_cov24-Prasinocladus_malaysianus.AAC.1